MANDHTTHALTRKYAELAGQLKKLNEETALVADQLNHVRATILIFQPNYPIRGIVPKRTKQPSDYGPKGVLMRPILDILRQSSARLTTRGIAERVLAQRGIMEPDEARTTLTIRNVNVALRSLEKRGLAASDGGSPQRWALV